MKNYDTMIDAEGMFDDSDPVLSCLQGIVNDGYQTDAVRFVARMAMKEILQLRDKVSTKKD